MKEFTFKKKKKSRFLDSRTNKINIATHSFSKLYSSTIFLLRFLSHEGKKKCFDQRTLRSSSVIGPVCSGGSAGEGKGELVGDGSSSGSSALPRDQSSSVVSLGSPSLPFGGPLSLIDLLISGSCVTPLLGSSHPVAVNATSDAELQKYPYPEIGLESNLEEDSFVSLPKFQPLQTLNESRYQSREKNTRETLLSPDFFSHTFASYSRLFLRLSLLL